MKNKILLLLGLFTLASCSDFLDRDPGDELSPNTFWKTEQDAKLNLVGCYSTFESGYNIMYWDCASDNAYNFHKHEGYRVLGSSTMSPADPGASWFSFGGIHACNEFLAMQDQVDFKTEGLKEQYEAEIRAIRAYHYFIRSTRYGDYPLFSENYENPEAAKVERTPKAQVNEFIEQELKEIIQILPKKNDSGRFNKAAAQALLMRFYLFNEKYEEALATANSIKGYSMPKLSFEESFLMDNIHNSEMILTRDYVLNSHQMDFTAFLPNSIGGWSSVVPTQSLVDAFEMQDGKTIKEALELGEYDPKNPYINRDPRLRATIIYPGQNYNGAIFDSLDPASKDYADNANNASKTGYNFKKFYSNLDQFGGVYWNTKQSFPIFRYAEVLLTIAESKIELNQIDDELYEAINQVRLRAEMPKVDRLKYNTQESLRELVRRERRVEFAMEGLRREDVVRWGIGEDTMGENLKTCPYGAVNHGDVVNEETGDVSVTLDKESKLIEERYFTKGKSELLPIPQTAMDKNKKLKQNPGY